MINIALRSTQKELMDTYTGNIGELKVILDDINTVNQWLGGLRITERAVFQMIASNSKISYTILDVGCADGFVLRSLVMAARKRGISLQCIGVDLNGDALQLAMDQSTHFPEIRYLQKDVLSEEVGALSCDIVISSLTMHHFSDPEIYVFSKRFLGLAKLGVVINDLHRSALAYYLFRVFSFFFIKTKTARIDGLISIQRAFKRKELEHFAEALPHAKHRIFWRWAFRYIWIFEHKSKKHQ
jgi:2-polyprenyl-3-methyl-5-hydroxy-6-metoxy-1,4-benzoquinol methylase